MNLMSPALNFILLLLVADGEAMLIDSGNVGKGEGVVEYLKGQGVKKFKYLILTHGHADHVGGMPEVLDAFPFEQMFVYDEPVCEEEPYKNFMGIIGERSYEYVMPELGSKHSLGKGEFIVLGPSRLDNSNLNNNSISIKFTYGNRSFLLCGDAQAMQETDLIKFAKENNISFFLLGNGSNLLVSDEGIRGAVVLLDGDFKQIKREIS